MFGFAVLELGTTEQAKAALEPFTAASGHSCFGAVAWGETKANKERAGFSTTATKSDAGWTLDGAKAYVVNADRAEHFVVFAQVDAAAGWRGLGAFLVDKSAKGLKVLPRETTLGLDAVSFGGLELTGVVVPDSARLLGGENFDAALVRFFARNALIIAARGVGLSRAAFEVTREYVDGRKAFGKPIGHFQSRRLHGRRPRDGRRRLAAASCGAPPPPGTPTTRATRTRRPRRSASSAAPTRSPSCTRPRCAAVTTACSSTAAPASCATTPSRS